MSQCKIARWFKHSIIEGSLKQKFIRNKITNIENRSNIKHRQMI